MPSPTIPDADPAGREAWLKAAARTLKGAPIASLATRTVDGIEIAALYDGGVAPDCLPTAAGWDIRALIDADHAAEANALGLEALGGGATSLLLVVDGSGVGSPADMARVLQGVVLEAGPAALDAGLLGPLAAEWLGDAAKGSPAARLDFHMDPLGAFAEAGQSPGPIEAHVERAAEVGAALAGTYPHASLLLASGRAAHEAGGSAAQELGVMAAAGVAYAKALARAGLPPEAAFGRITLGLSVDSDVLVGIAKLRAARRIWARIAAALGSRAPARIEVRSSRRMLTAADPWTNLLRLTLAGFAGAVGGADAMILGAFTDALGRPAERARRLARNTQLILSDEAGLGHAADPAAGAWALEALSDQLARQGWSILQAIEQRGGLAAALGSGFITAEVAGVRAAREQAIGDGVLPILGVTDFPDPEPLPVETLAPRAPRGRAVPDIRLPGPDSRCPPLTPIRVSVLAEDIARDLAP
ncbi:MAG TPA: methylmalonyl-CoA mutase family protein [Caulobacteraceae bacterium]